MHWISSVRNRLRKLIKSCLFFVLFPIDRLATTRKTKTSSNTLLIVRLDAIGDYILFRNFFQVLRKSKRFKGYHIMFCGNLACKDVFDSLDSGFVDEAIWIDWRRFATRPLYRLRCMRDINRKGFETVLHPVYSREAITGDAIVRAARGEHAIGVNGDTKNMSKMVNKITDGFYNHLLDIGAGVRFEFLLNKSIFEELLGQRFTLPAPFIQLKRSADFRPPCKGKYSVLFPGAGNRGRQWPTSAFAAIADKIHNAGGDHICICGSASDRELAERIRVQATVPVLDLTGQTNLTQLIHIVSAARVIVSNETSAVHIAAAVSTPAVCILGGGHFGHFMPYPVQVAKHLAGKAPVAVYTKMACYNCNWHCMYKIPSGEPFPCIRQVSVATVWRKVRAILDQG